MTKRYEVMKDLSPWCREGEVIETDEDGNLSYPRFRSSVNQTDVINGLMYEHDIPAYIDAGFIREVPEAKPKVAEYELTEVTAYNGVLWTHFDDVDHKIPVDAISRHASFAGFLTADKEEMRCDPMWRHNISYELGSVKWADNMTLVRPGFVRWLKK